MNVRIKICGITTESAVETAGIFGVDAVGFVFADSPRRVTPGRAAELVGRIPPFISAVAVFRYPTPHHVAETLAAFPADLVQTEVCPALFEAIPDTVRVLPVCHDGEDYDLAAMRNAQLGRAGGAILLEGAGRGGRGVSPNWDHAARLARRLPIVLAGGLTAANVGDAIRRVRPFAVDVSSGVETAPGIKDPTLIADFVHAVRQAELHLAADAEALV